MAWECSNQLRDLVQNLVAELSCAGVSERDTSLEYDCVVVALTAAGFVDGRRLRGQCPGVFPLLSRVPPFHGASCVSLELLTARFGILIAGILPPTIGSATDADAPPAAQRRFRSAAEARGQLQIALLL